MIKLGERGAVYALFSIVVLGCALGALSQTAMNAMISAVCVDLGVTVDLAQLLTSGYMLVVGIVIPLVTFLSRRLSTRALVFLAFGLMGLGSVAGLLATAFPILVLGRILQACGTGITLPFMQAIAIRRFPVGQNATAMGVAGIALGFAPNVGPTVGGALVGSWGWRSFFLIVLVIVVALALATWLFVSKDDSPAEPAHLDAASVVLSTLGFGGLLLGFTFASSFPLGHPLVWAPIIVGTVALVVFVRRQKGITTPLINMGIFASSHYRIGFTATIFLFANFMGITLIAPLFVENVTGGSALEAGIVFIPATVLAIVLNPVSGILADKVGTRPVCVVAGVLLCVGSIGMALMDETTPLWLITVLQTVRGAGVSSLIGPMTSWSLVGLKGPIVMDGSAFTATTRQVAASLGVAVMIFLITVLGVQVDAGAVGVALPYQAAFGVSALCGLACFGIIAAKVRN